MAEWDRPPDGEGIPSWVNASVMGLSGSASFARPRSRAAEEAASLGVAGEPSDAAETEAARLPRSYQMLLHLQQNGADAADADDPVLAITQAKAAAVRSAPLLDIAKFP